MYLWIVRHGRPGNGVDEPLSPAGEREAELTGLRLKDEGITHILSSPLLRALDTAAIITHQLNGSPITVWPELREGFSYQHRAWSRADLEQRYPGVVFPLGFAEGGWDYGGDTYELMLDRCRGVLRRLEDEFAPEDRVLIVAHGGLTNHFLHILLQIPPETPAWFETDYCAISRLRLVPAPERIGWHLYPPVGLEILCLNDIAHLPEGKHSSSRI